MLNTPKFLFIALLLMGTFFVSHGFGADAPAQPKKTRVPWTSSNLQGTPDPPPPYRVERAFPRIHFKAPTVITSAPGTDRIFVAEQAGKVYSIPNDPTCDAADLFLDIEALIQAENAKHAESTVHKPIELVAIYGLTFHPNFATNRLVYVCYVVRDDPSQGPTQQKPNGTRVVSFHVSETDPPEVELNSQEFIITWLEGGHNGGCLKFGHDGCLYISTGDGGFANPPDGLDSGQDLTNLLSSILRIDVDHPEDGRAYRIPQDNPFVDRDNSRGEIWAYGLRNPWKMSFDRATGELWVGDVGWELWELIYRVNPGDNFGWSLVEGRQAVHPGRQRGPTPIVAPTLDIPHVDGASITGGFVYRGKKHPELVGTYIFGDWETRRIWGLPVKGQHVGTRFDLVENTVRIVGFGEDRDGELLMLDYDAGTLHRFSKREVQKTQAPFPTTLTETGLFDSVKNHQFAPGVMPFSINTEQWMDHATAIRFVAIPGDAAIQLFSVPESIDGSMFTRSIDFPTNSVLGKTIAIEMQAGSQESQRKLETQLLHFDGSQWRGYSYAWNEDQTDATLVPAEGATRELIINDHSAPGGSRQHTWQFSSRNQCIRCHNPWAEHTLAFNVPQLNQAPEFNQKSGDQLRALIEAGLVEDAGHLFGQESLPTQLFNPFDENSPLDDRSRSYLHVNCAHCHRENGGGVAYLSLEADLPLTATKLIRERPTQGTFGLPRGQLIEPGAPFRSILFYRMSTLASGHMPHLGTSFIDRNGLDLIHRWIQQMPQGKEEIEVFEQLLKLDRTESAVQKSKHRDSMIERIAGEIAAQDNRTLPTSEDWKLANQQTQRTMSQTTQRQKLERQKLLERILESTNLSLIAMQNIERQEFSPMLVAQLIEQAAKVKNPSVRGLFERFFSSTQRTRRLGDVIDTDSLLALQGDIRRGQQLFFETDGIQCKNCHQIKGQGKKVGPELSTIGQKNNTIQLLDSILKPSKNIDPKYAMWFVETVDGLVRSGLLVETKADSLLLQNAEGVVVEIPKEDIEEMLPQRKSLMPDLLLRDMTAQQVADLLAFLASLK